MFGWRRRQKKVIKEKNSNIIIDSTNCLFLHQPKALNYGFTCFTRFNGNLPIAIELYFILEISLLFWSKLWMEMQLLISVPASDCIYLILDLIRLLK